MARIRVKICCIGSLDESRAAIAAGADALGLVGPMPSGPGVIEASLIAEIALHTPPPVAAFLLASDTTASELAARFLAARPTALQLVDAVPQPEISRLRAALPGIKLVQVIHVTSPSSIDEALAAATWADALLLDSGNPALTVKVLGGTGKVHDWNLSRRIVDQCKLPVFLAGGLRPDNVAQALDTVAPFGLDVCSGIRTHGRLDPQKMETFFRNAGC